MTYSKKYKQMKKDLNLTNKDVAEITGNTRDSVQVVTGPNGRFPRWAKFAIWVWEKMNERLKKNV